MTRLSLSGISAVILSFSLAGCAGLAPKVQEVKVPVPVPCKVEVPLRPAFAVDGLPVGSGIWEQMKALTTLAEGEDRDFTAEERESSLDEIARAMSELAASGPGAAPSLRAASAAPAPAPES